MATVKCPHCGAPVPWTPASRHRPFCSERCRLIDLGGWFDGRNHIPGPELQDGESLDRLHPQNDPANED